MYFDNFPTIPYDAEGNGKFKDVKNLLRRVGIRTKVKVNAMLFDTYDVKNGETPESIAFKLYGDSELHWVIMLINDITDRFYDWPLTNSAFEEYVKQKYDNPGAVHHYEKDQTSGVTNGNRPGDFSHKVEVNSTDADGQSVSNYEYESRIQDQKRQIKLLDKAYLNTFVEEFERLVKR